MTELEKIEEKLRAAKAEVKSITAQRNLLLAFSKVNIEWGIRLPPEMEQAISSVVEEYLSKEQAQAVLSACYIFLRRTLKLRHDSLKELSNKELARFHQPPKKRGRPKGSSDHDAKVLINSLAAIWEKAGNTLPVQVESRFGKFVGEIAKALQVKEAKSGEYATWAGQVNDVLSGEGYARIREASDHYIGGLPFALKEKLEAVDCSDWKERLANNQAQTIGAAIVALECVLEENRVSEEINKIPGIEKFTLTIKRGIF